MGDSPRDRYHHLDSMRKVEAHDEEFWKLGVVGRGLQLWIMNDFYETELDPSDGLRNSSSSKSEAFTKCPIVNALEF